MTPKGFKDSCDAIDLFFKQCSIRVSEHLVELFLIQHGSGHTFTAVQDLLKALGFRSLLISHSFDEIRALPLPVFIQSKTGFFYLLNIDKATDGLIINNQEITKTQLDEDFSPYFLLSEQLDSKGKLDLLKHPFSTVAFRMTIPLFGLLLLISLFISPIAFVAFLGIGICTIAYGKDLIDSFDQSLLKYVCSETKLTSCKKDNSINKIVMPLMGVVFFTFFFLGELMSIDLLSVVMGSFFFGLLVIMYSFLIQFRNGKFCQLCLIIIANYLLLNYLIYIE